MSDEPENKSSLRGRGRDIMRGPSEGDINSDVPSGGWLPSASEDENDAPSFEDDQALLKWMEVDPERNRPTFVPNKRLVETPKVDTGILYPDPDFDAIFGDEEEDDTAIPMASASSSPAIPMPSPAQFSKAADDIAQPARTLDDLFQSEDPVFDDIFGDAALLPSQSTTPPYESLAVPNEYPLPETGRLFMQADNVVYDDLPEEDLEGLMPPFEAEYIPEAPEAEDIPTAYMELVPPSDNRFLPDEPTLKLSDQPLPPLDEILGFEPDFLDWEDPNRSTLELPAVEDDHTPTQAARTTSVLDKDLDATIEAPVTPEPDPYFEAFPVDEEEEADTAIGISPEAIAPEPMDSDAPTADLSELLAEEFDDYYPDEPVPAEASHYESDFDEPAPAEASHYESDFDEPVPAEASHYESDFDEPAPAEASHYESDFDEPTPAEASHYAPDTSETIPLAPSYYELPSDEPILLPISDDIPDFAKPAPIAQDSFEAFEDDYADATDILSQNFEDEREIASAHKPALDLLEQISGDIPSSELPTGEYWEDEPEPLRQDPSAESFVRMLEREAAESGQYYPSDYGDEEDVITHAANSLGDWDEALPMAESATRPVDLRNANIKYSAFDKLNPREPEVLPGGQEFYEEPPAPQAEEVAVTIPPAIDDFPAEAPIPAEEEVTRGVDTNALATSDLLQPKVVRPSATALFQPSTLTPDHDLVNLLVDDNRLRELFEQIEGLHEDIVQNVRGDRGNSDIYQEELVYASNLLMSSRDNYDEARGIVYRVRADLNRERRVEEDIRKFRPTLNLIYLLLAIAIFILILMGGFFSDIAEGLGAGWIAQGYYPALAGMGGALMAGILSFSQSNKDRNFDALNVNQYLWKPLLGLVSGFIAYLFLAAPSAATLDSTVASEVARSPFTIIVAIAFGLFQEAVIGVLSNSLSRLLPSNSNDDPPSRSSR